jgi:hypothetical protein
MRKAIDQRSRQLTSIEGAGSGRHMAQSHADQVPSIRLGVQDRARPQMLQNKKDHARETETVILHPCSMLVLARGNRLVAGPCTVRRGTPYEHRLGRLAGHAWRISAKRADVGRWTCLITSEAEAGPHGRCAGLRPVESRERESEPRRSREVKAAVARLLPDRRGPGL